MRAFSWRAAGSAAWAFVSRRRGKRRLGFRLREIELPLGGDGARGLSVVVADYVEDAERHAAGQADEEDSRDYGLAVHSISSMALAPSLVKPDSGGFLGALQLAPELGILAEL